MDDNCILRVLPVYSNWAHEIPIAAFSDDYMYMKLNFLLSIERLYSFL